jgi:Family of unknown function (DUF6194)
MTITQLQNLILESYPGLNSLDTYGEKSFFYNPENLLTKGIYFATLKEKDGPNDKASDLNREGVFRLNLGISKQSYEKLFGTKPKRPPKGGIVDTGHDFKEFNKITPHPIYAWLHWIAILNPDDDSMSQIKELMDETYQNVQKKYATKIKQLTKKLPKYA